MKRKKTCRRCKEDKLLKEFGTNNNMIDLKQPYCLVCSREYAAEWRKKNPDKLNLHYDGYDKEYYEANKDRILKHTKNFYVKNKEYWVKYREEHRKEALEAVKKWEAKNPTYHHELYLKKKAERLNKQNKKKK